MSFIDSFNISASGMTAQRTRMDVISENVANANSTNGPDGKPYRRKVVKFEQISTGREFKRYLNRCNNSLGGGVKITSIEKDMSPFQKIYDPSHPDADGEGYVDMPNVNSVEEMTNLIDATRAYEANVTAFNATKAMAAKALKIGN